MKEMFIAIFPSVVVLATSILYSRNELNKIKEQSKQDLQRLELELNKQSEIYMQNKSIDIFGELMLNPKLLEEWIKQINKHNKLKA